MTTRFVDVDRTGYGVETTVLGLRELEKGLRSFDPELAKKMDKAIRAAIDPVVKAARGFVPDEALSGWDDEGTGEWSTRLGWNAAQVRRGIRMRKGSKRRARNGTSVAWRIQQFDAAGAVFELAGRRSSGNFQSNLTREHGRASRLIWRAWDQQGDEVVPKIRRAVEDAENELQRRLDAAGGA